MFTVDQENEFRISTTSDISSLAPFNDSEGLNNEDCLSISNGNRDEDLDYFENSDKDTHHSFLSSENEGLSIRKVSHETELKEYLSYWIVKHCISHVAASSLLLGLKSLRSEENDFKYLPNDSRSLLKTQRHLTLTEMLGGKYYHFGIEQYLTQKIKNFGNEMVEAIQLLINIDEIPLTRSSSSVFWPVLGLIKGERTPFLIGVFHGFNKPECVNEYLRPFVDEVNHLKDVCGISIN